MSGTASSRQSEALAIDQTLREAISQHRAGRLQEAEELYRAILRAEANHPDANHNLGVLGLQVGQAPAGLPHLRTALEANPNQSQYWLSYANALFAAGRYPDALPVAQGMTARFPSLGPGWKALGAVLKQLGRNLDALPAMQTAIRLLPDDAEAHNNLGNTFNDLGRYDEAESACRRALALDPACAGAHYNLGVILRNQRRPAEAEACLRRALAIRPDYADAYNNLGITLRKLGKTGEVEALYRRALAINPDFAEAHVNLGNTLRDVGRLVEAEACYRRALALDCADAQGHLGAVLIDQGRLDEALDCYRQLAKQRPEDGVARHLIASLTGNNTECAPAQYVATVFDGYADKFETHLQQVLGYECPAKLVELILRHATPPTGKWNVLDLGCGTGLVGQSIAPHAGILVGVDLSPRMLDKAAAKNIYRRLECMDLLAMMRSEKSSSYDVIVAADVFIYVGRIDEIVGEAQRLLGPGGSFAFSIEAMDGPPDEEDIDIAGCGYKLEKTGRYSHSAAYIIRLASANGFQVCQMVATTIRMERGKPIPGFLVLLKSLPAVTSVRLSPSPSRGGPGWGWGS